MGRVFIPRQGENKQLLIIVTNLDLALDAENGFIGHGARFVDDPDLAAAGIDVFLAFVAGSFHGAVVVIGHLSDNGAQLGLLAQEFAGADVFDGLGPGATQAEEQDGDGLDEAVWHDGLRFGEDNALA